MSVYKRGEGRWQVRVDLDRSVDGKRRRRALGSFKTRKSAEAAERDALSARERGHDLATGKVSVAVVLERYLVDRATRCGEKTIQEYRGIATRYVVPHLGALALARLRPVHVSDWQASLAVGGGKAGAPVSAKTVFHARALLGGALGWAVKMGLVERNVVAAVDAPAVRRSNAKAIDSAEIARILDAAAVTRWHSFFSLAFAIGARRGELLALRWSVVDLERRTVTIAAALSQTKAGIAVKSTKSDRVRIVPLSAFALDAIRRQRAAQAQDKLAAGSGYLGVRRPARCRPEPLGCYLRVCPASARSRDQYNALARCAAHRRHYHAHSRNRCSVGRRDARPYLGRDNPQHLFALARRPDGRRRRSFGCCDGACSAR